MGGRARWEVGDVTGVGDCEGYMGACNEEFKGRWK
jgi:hypothetical protein